MIFTIARLFEPRNEKTCLRDLRPGRQNRPAQPQKLARGLKFRIYELEVFYYLGYENYLGC